MNSQQRVMTALDFQQPDYMPFHVDFWPEWAEMWREAHPDCADVDLGDHYGVDIKIAVGDETPYMTKAATLREEDGYEIKRDGWGRTNRVRPDAYFMHQIDNAYDESGELKYGEFDAPDLPERYAALDAVMDDLKQRYCVFVKTGGPFIRTYFMTGEVNLLMNMAGDKELAREQVMRTAHHLAAIGVEQLRRWDLYETGVWIFDDMAATDLPMFSPKTAEEILAPAWGYMVDTYKQAGAKKVVLHSDGNIGPLLDLFIDLGFDGINPVEYKAGLDCVELREKYGDKLALIGGLSNGLILPHGNPEEVKDHTLRMMSAGKEGGMVLGTHSVGPDISLDTWELTCQTYMQYRDYPLNLPAGY